MPTEYVLAEAIYLQPSYAILESTHNGFVIVRYACIDCRREPPLLPPSPVKGVSLALKTFTCH